MSEREPVAFDAVESDDPRNEGLSKTTIVIAAHCDDLELGVGGTVAKLAHQGWNVHAIIIDSQPITYDSSDDHYAQLTTIRESEALNGARILGIRRENIHFLRASSDTSQRQWNVRHLVHEIHSYCKERFGTNKPPLPFVFTHTRHDRHNHHVQANTITGQAFKLPILCFKVSSSSDSTFAPVVGVDIGNWIDLKEAAFKAHESQRELRFADGVLALESLRKDASEWSTELQFQFGELFECDLTDSLSLNQVRPLITLFDSDYHFRLFQRQITASKSSKTRSEWIPTIVAERERQRESASHITPRPNVAASEILARNLLPSYFALNAIDGCLEVLATPDDESRYSGYTREQVHCTFVPHQWNPSRDTTQGEKTRIIMLGVLHRWLQQKSKPKRIATLRRAPLAPLTDRQEVRLTFGSSDYFTVRTITQLVRDIHR